MSFKTIFVIAVTALVTIILMNNADEVNFWIFGEVKISKLLILGVMFVLGFIVGAIAFRSRKKAIKPNLNDEPVEPVAPTSHLSDEDREYIR